MGDVVQLDFGRLPTANMEVAEIEVACLQSAASLAHATAEWMRWDDYGIDMTSPLKIAEELLIDLIRHNRRHLAEHQVRSSERLASLTKRMQQLIDAANATRDKYPR